MEKLEFEFEDGDGEDRMMGRGRGWWSRRSPEKNCGGLGTSQKGSFAWEVHDFKYMPGNEGLTKEEMEDLCIWTLIR